MAKDNESQQALSKRDLLSNRFKDKYPDREFADDEALFGQINDDYDAYDNEIGEYKKREKAMSDLFTADPRSARFIMAMKDGEYPLTALIKSVGKDTLLEMLNDEEKAKEFADAHAEYLERVAENKQLEEEYNNNLAKSLSLIDKMQAEKGLGDEQMDAAFETLSTIVKDGLKGKFSKESIELALKANGYDEAVANAAYEGEVKGRNAKIDEKLRTRGASDGIAPLDGKNNVGKAEPRKMRTIFDEARDAI